MALYDQFIEHWLERGKRRLEEKKLVPLARAAFENLIDEGFTRNGVDYLKKLSVALYREQAGQPIVSYLRYKDESSRKAEFFGREEEKPHTRCVSPVDILTGTCLHVLEGHHGSVIDVTYSLRGDHVATASYDMTVKVWDVATGKCHHILLGHIDYVFGVKYSPKVDQLASNSQDHTVRLWDIETQKCLHVLSGHGRSVRSIAYSPQGHQLASASDDKTMRLWNVDTGNCYYMLTGHSNTVYSVMYSPNGDQVASASADKSV
ncbi:MAG: WD40-repeat-containing domain protein [Benniella sp.]|nr:MAG: WD40-repeat-containing domain protein [Benniella sp.]